LLALLAPVLAVEIENLGRLNASLSEIINIRSLDSLTGTVAGTADWDVGVPVVLSFLMVSHTPGCIRDCSDLPSNSPSGIYVIKPKGYRIIVVYCEMQEEGGGWTVIQRNRQDTDNTWDESWSTYKHGFGNMRGEFWLGTEYIHQITRQKPYQVRFVIWDASNNKRFADYNLFSLDDESQGYRLRLGAHSGTAEDAMASGSITAHDNMKFSTKDRDEDTFSGDCASVYGGGWWYSACYSVRLNFKGPLTWGSLCKGNCKASAILIKPLTC
ncbi:FGL1L protein, partial [Tachuris rubrigastra]|nr:FGL1L protein [Tachuris rubrigastra]